jgi:polypyrimidine tract-binding protein 2
MPILAMPGEPSVAQPSHTFNEPRLQTFVVLSGGPPQYPSQAMLHGPPGVVLP